MTTSRRVADRQVVRFDRNITKRGTVPETTVKKGKEYPVDSSYSLSLDHLSSR